jgi:two-component system chemotaxis sensor kinase CheA
MIAEDDEIVQEFLVESYENLDQLDRDLVELEQQPGSRELLSAIFRTIHTIKGTSGFLAFGRLEGLTHVGENLLSRLRDGELTMTPPIAEALLRMVDSVRALLAVIEETGGDVDDGIDVDSVIESIRSCVESPVSVEELAVAAAEAALAVETVAIEVAAASGAVSDVDVRVEAAVVVESAAAAEPMVATATVVETLHVEALHVEHGDSHSAQPEQPAAPAEPHAVPHVHTPRPNVSEAARAETGDGEGGGEARRSSVGDSTVRVDVELLDTLVTLVGELVLTRNQILQTANADANADLVRASQRLNLVASELQENVMRTRMQPIGQIWTKFPRVVRDLGAQLGKNVKLEMDGQETELDRSLLEAVKDPLTHLVRNAIDHGIEPSSERVAKGKPAHGTLSLRAFHESGQVVVDISDDGKGLDPDKIGSVAVARGVVTTEQLARMSDRDVLDLIFRPGFSTAAAVTNVSGRGVGMDVVRTNIERIGGTVDLNSQLGRGTTIRVRIPLTLAIIPALVVFQGNERYAIPQANLVELVRLEAADLARDVETLAGAPILRLRGQLLPLISLSSMLGVPEQETEAVTIVVVQADDLRFGISVAGVHDTQEIVVKPLGRQLKGIPMYAGATIMGDGRVALILDVAGLAQSANISAAAGKSAESVKSADSDATALLVLDLGADRRAALPLAQVSRLEEFSVDRIERSGQAEVVQYRDGILPLVRLAKAIGLAPADEPDLLSVIVHDEGNGRVGIVANRVVDVVETTIAVTGVGVRHGVIGTAVVQDRVTDLVDLEAVVLAAGVSA